MKRRAMGRLSFNAQFGYFAFNVKTLLVLIDNPSFDAHSMHHSVNDRTLPFR
jgi:hypothetical protein